MDNLSSFDDFISRFQSLALGNSRTGNLVTSCCAQVYVLDRWLLATQGLELHYRFAHAKSPMRDPLLQEFELSDLFKMT